MNLWEISQDLSKRLINLFTYNTKEKSRVYLGKNNFFKNNNEWLPYLEFNEYFHGDTGVGLGARHQTGWTGLIAKIIMQFSEYQHKT